MTEPLLGLDRVSQVFRTQHGPVRAVDDVSLNVEPGHVLCLVGESGSGKTTTAKLAAGLRLPTDGAVRFLGPRPSGRSAPRRPGLRRKSRPGHPSRIHAEDYGSSATRPGQASLRVRVESAESRDAGSDVAPSARTGLLGLTPLAPGVAVIGLLGWAAVRLGHRRFRLRRL